jgi:hypothetical protein
LKLKLLEVVGFFQVQPGATVKTKFLSMLAVGSVCATGCAAPLAVTLLSRSGSALLVTGAEWLSAFAAVGLAIVLWRCLRALPIAVSGASNGCGCSVATRQTPQTHETVAPIACAPSTGEYQQRAVRIREMAAKSLRFARRGDLRLTLTYDHSALAEVQKLIRDEQTCCPFLSFDIQDNDTEVCVVVTAPNSARDAAEELF